jgi:polyisoprenoid-binding protein YceI
MSQATKEIEGITLPPAGTYVLDPAHTAVEFVARHMLAKVRGRFTDFDGTVVVAEDPASSSVEVEVRTASIQTNTEQRDEHLRSADFLHVEEHPTMTFRSTGLRRVDGAGFELDGDLTIRGITRPITLRGEYLGLSRNPYGKTVLSASARTSLVREDWDMTWNVAIETGGWLVGKAVDVEIEVEAILQEDEGAEPTA